MRTSYAFRPTVPHSHGASHGHDWKFVTLAIHPFTAAIRQLEANAKPKESIYCDCLTILCLLVLSSELKGIMEAYQAAGPNVGKIVHIKAGSGLSLEMGWI